MALRTDITERKLAQIAKNKLGSLLSNLLDAATEMSIIATDDNGLITIFNRGAENLLGYKANEMIGKSSLAPLHQPQEIQERAVELTVEYGNAIEGFDVFVYKARTEGPETMNWTYIRKDGSQCQVSLSVSAMCDSDGKVVGYLGIAVDITEQHLLEASLRNAKLNADMASEAKSEFLANMSHEIRTPMNGVLGMLSLLLKSDLKEEQRKKASLAQSSAKSLLILINDILDYSKVDAGKLELENLDFDVRKMVGEFAESVAIQVEEKELELILDLSGIEYTLVKGDSNRLRQILSNLVGNAIKFTAQGEIVIKAKLSNFDDLHWGFECSIKDTGIGIPKETLSALFDSFSQADSSTTRIFGGTGLGLAIAKKLCQLMGGGISATTELNQGSCFKFYIYLNKSSASQLALPKIDISTLSVLIVDDNATNREVLKGQLELWGGEVCTADSGKQAMKLCGSRLAQQDKRFFDIAFLDMQMPKMNGAMLGKLLQTSQF